LSAHSFWLSIKSFFYRSVLQSSETALPNHLLFGFKSKFTKMLFAKVLSFLLAFVCAACALPTRRQTNYPSNSTTSTSGSSGSGVAVFNHLDAPINLWSVTNEQGPMITIPGGGSWTQQFLTNPDGGGVSIKMSPTTMPDQPLQLEYTLTDGTIWYDLSCINMDDDPAFVKAGYELVPGVSSCDSIICAPDDADCNAAYEQPDDNSATHACSSSTLLTMTIGIPSQ
jgi:hypothetical protein